jgi:hypothetical protein
MLSFTSHGNEVILLHLLVIVTQMMYLWPLIKGGVLHVWGDARSIC